MKYVGSKNRISKYLLPILQGYIDEIILKHTMNPV